jgi:hypothetical protein
VSLLEHENDLSIIADICVSLDRILSSIKWKLLLFGLAGLLEVDIHATIVPWGTNLRSTRSKPQAPIEFWSLIRTRTQTVRGKRDEHRLTLVDQL